MPDSTMADYFAAAEALAKRRMVDGEAIHGKFDPKARKEKWAANGAEEGADSDNYAYMEGAELEALYPRDKTKELELRLLGIAAMSRCLTALWIQYGERKRRVLGCV